jgi:hypothetical protein
VLQDGLTFLIPFTDWVHWLISVVYVKYHSPNSSFKNISVFLGDNFKLPSRYDFITYLKYVRTLFLQSKVVSATPP